MTQYKVVIIFFLIIFLGLPSQLQAQDYKADYSVEYFLNKDQSALTSHVKLTIKTTNLRSDVYIKKFTLAFPKSFDISNLKTRDDEGEIKPVLTEKEDSYNIEIEFSDPKIGKNSINNFYLDFDQYNLFQINGEIWEVILPTIENRGEESYQVVVNLPDNQKKISIAKPKPDNITGTKITWNNPLTKTIYAVFGNQQAYLLKLTYNLKNPRLTPIYTEVAFPPDMSNQKIFINNIQPQPNTVYLDQDGNYIGKYYLKPKEEKTVRFNGIAVITPTARAEVKQFETIAIKAQERYLLTETKYWNLSNPGNFNQLQNPKDIYNFVVQNLKYNFNRLERNSIGRFGADMALQKPNQAVCVEFTDTFIALAREQGIPTREIQGYAVTQDARLRPLSLLKDVLHSWPEYYDKSRKNWVQIDPTWENTSGIDYFTSFDLNHIAFAIHGKNPEQPLPAGMYKTEDTKDVSVIAAEIIPQENKKVRIKKVEIDKTLNDTTLHRGSFIVKNEGNTFVYNTPVTVTGGNLLIEPSYSVVDVLAPYEEKRIHFTTKSKIKNQYIIAKLTISAGNFDTRTIQLSVTPYSYLVGFAIAGLCVFVFGSFLLFLRIKRRERAL